MGCRWGFFTFDRRLRDEFSEDLSCRQPNGCASARGVWRGWERLARHARWPGGPVAWLHGGTHRDLGGERGGKRATPRRPAAHRAVDRNGGGEHSEDWPDPCGVERRDLGREWFARRLAAADWAGRVATRAYRCRYERRGWAASQMRRENALDTGKQEVQVKCVLDGREAVAPMTANTSRR